MEGKCWATCPNCGDNLVYESFTFDDSDSDTVFMKGKGHCCCCGKKWEWEEKFTLSEIRFFEDITENTDY